MILLFGIFLALAAAVAFAQPADNMQAEPAPMTDSRRVASLKLGSGPMHMEHAWLDRAPQARRMLSVRAAPFLAWQPNRNWELRVGAKLDGDAQSGGNASFDDWHAELDEAYVRYRSGTTRISLGSQTVVWGRVDAIPVIDRVSRADLSRFMLDDLTQRRRSQPIVRLEHGVGDLKIDAVVMPRFHGARLPDFDSVWSPIDKNRGRIIGLEPSVGLAGLVRAAQVKADSRGFGGAALRLTQTGGEFDWGMTAGRTRQAIPYYQVNLAHPSLTAMHPLTSFVSVDGEISTGGVSWRAELAAADGTLVTLSDSTAIATRAIEAVAGAEFFPGGANTRVTLQLAARRVTSGRAILELREYLAINGAIETTVAQGRWKLALTFLSGITIRDVYLGPKVTFAGWEPHEIYLAGMYFDGADRTLTGFHRDHRGIALGVKLAF